MVFKPRKLLLKLLKKKKRPLKKFGKETGLLPIIGVRGSESLLRKAQYGNTTDNDEYGGACFTNTGKFTPLHDLEDDLFEKIYKQYNIATPKIYNSIAQTGCMGCPYGSYGGHTKIELDLLPKNKRNFIIEYFKESYDILGIEYETQQTKLDI